MQEYADPVIDWLDAGMGILDKRLFREVRKHSLLCYARVADFCLVVHATTERLIYQGPYSS